jgi:uncharacterized repeat protein (TIGR04076 family)
VYELWVSVERVEGACTATVPMEPGVGFLVRNGRLVFPGGGPICLYALQSILPLLPAKERSIDEPKAGDWMWRVDAAQCSDPKGRTIWKIERRPLGSTDVAPPLRSSFSERCNGELETSTQWQPYDLVLEVERVDGVCTAGMTAGDRALVCGSGLYLAKPFCLYALHAALPLLPAMQRHLDPDDWMTRETAVICPDPAGNVLLRILRRQAKKR